MPNDHVELLRKEFRNPHNFNLAHARECLESDCTLDEAIDRFIDLMPTRDLAPNAWFDPEFYTHTYPDVAEAKMNSFAHFLLVGKSKGRYPNAKILRDDVNAVGKYDIFNVDKYKDQVGDVTHERS